MKLFDPVINLPKLDRLNLLLLDRSSKYGKEEKGKLASSKNEMKERERELSYRNIVSA